MIAGTKFLVAVEGSKESENAFEKCLPLLKPQDTVLLLMITDMTKFVESEHALDYSTFVSETVLQNYKVKCAKAMVGCECLVLSLSSDGAGPQICSVAQEHKAGTKITKLSELRDFIILGSHHKNPIEKLLQGSVSEYCFRNAPCPLITVKYEPERAKQQEPQQTQETAQSHLTHPTTPQHPINPQ